jgi:hypothetical protein
MVCNGLSLVFAVMEGIVPVCISSGSSLAGNTVLGVAYVYHRRRRRPSSPTLPRVVEVTTDPPT